jgi:putative membrane protein
MLMVSFLVFISSAAIAQDLDKRIQNEIPDENDFITKAASSSMMDIELGNMAQEKGKSQKVKEIGERMVRDHSKASDELKDIAQRNNIELPDSMLSIHKMHVEELSGLSGEEFDIAYLEALHKHHEMDIAEFENASESYEIRDVRKWARKILSDIRDHEELVNRVMESLE